MGKFVCYCSKVSEADIRSAIDGGASSLDEVIRMTGAMENSNCKVNNPKGVCCYGDLKAVFERLIGGASEDDNSKTGCDCGCSR